MHLHERFTMYNIMFLGSAFADESGFHYALLALPLFCCYISTSRPRSELWGIVYLHPDCAWPFPFHTMLCTRTMLSRLCSQSAYLLLQRRLEMSIKIASNYERCLDMESQVLLVERHVVCFRFRYR